MSRIGTFIDIENSIDIPTVEWLVNVDKNRAAMYKLTPSDISGFLSMATGGMKISTYNRDEEVDIVMRFPEKYRKITNIKN